MKQLLFIISTLFAFNGFACLNGIETDFEELSLHVISNNQSGLSLQNPSPNNDHSTEENDIGNTAEKPKKKKKIIKGLIYYLGGGFVVLVIVMIFFIRKKPKRP